MDFLTNDQILLVTTNLAAHRAGLEQHGPHRRHGAGTHRLSGDHQWRLAMGPGGLQEQVDTNWFTVDEAAVVWQLAQSERNFQRPPRR